MKFFHCYDYLIWNNGKIFLLKIFKFCLEFYWNKRFLDTKYRNPVSYSTMFCLESHKLVKNWKINNDLKFYALRKHWDFYNCVKLFLIYLVSELSFIHWHIQRCLTGLWIRLQYHIWDFSPNTWWLNWAAKPKFGMFVPNEC